MCAFAPMAGGAADIKLQALVQKCPGIPLGIDDVFDRLQARPSSARTSTFASLSSPHCPLTIDRATGGRSSFRAVGWPRQTLNIVALVMGRHVAKAKAERTK